MKKYFRLVAVPALALAMTMSVTPSALADEPAAVQQDASQATISALETPITEPQAYDRWRVTLDKISEGKPWADRLERLNAHSPSMDRDVPLAVIRAASENAPTIYLLSGAGAAEQGMDWISGFPELVEFYIDKDVNVVIPEAGAFSYYMDWYSEPTGNGIVKGKQKWETFLTKELPGPIESHLKASADRGIVGFSMSGTSAPLLAAHHPGFYKAVAGFSGFYQTNTDLARAAHALTLNRGGATVEQMLGPVNGDFSRYNDPVINAEGLRGANMYFSNGSGLAGRTDQVSYLMGKGNNQMQATSGAWTLQVEGGIIEGATNVSTHNLKAKLDSLGIPAHFEFRNSGTHSWPYWKDDLFKSWDIAFAPAFGK